MSAFILSDKHFSVIAQYIANNNINIDYVELQNRLKKINIDSVNYRYNEKTRFNKVKFKDNISEYNYNKYDIIQLIECWDYQACENKSSLDYNIMQGFLLSHFSENEIIESAQKSIIWSI